MKKTGILLLAVVILALTGCSKKKVDSELQTQQHNEQVTVTEVTPLTDVLANPAEYVGKTILVEGQVTGRCAASGCWISLKVGDNDRGVIVTTLDESWIFPEDCVGKTVLVQGALKLKNAEEMQEQEEEAKGANHECPNPEYIFVPNALKVKA